MAPEIFLSRAWRATRCSEQVTSLTGEPRSQSRVGRMPHPCKAAASWPPSREPLSLHLFLLLPSTTTHAAATTLPYFPLQQHFPLTPLPPYYCPNTPTARGWQKSAQAHLVPAICPKQLLQTFGFTRSIRSFDTFVCLWHTSRQTGCPQAVTDFLKWDSGQSAAIKLKKKKRRTSNPSQPLWFWVHLSLLLDSDKAVFQIGTCAY